MTQRRRFKVQRRVDVTARDQANRPFLFARYWLTLKQADKQVTAEKVLLSHKADNPTHEYRLAEEWPLGTEVRPIFRTRARSVTNR